MSSPPVATQVATQVATPTYCPLGHPISIEKTGERGQPLMRWHLRDANPCPWSEVPVPANHDPHSLPAAAHATLEEQLRLEAF
jgi:hypothetical protein